MTQRSNTPVDAVVVGSGHNGLVAATTLARAGWSVRVLERREELGGATVSGRPFEGVEACVSRYSYLVSLFPSPLAKSLGLKVPLRTRAVSSYTPAGDSGLLVCTDEQTTGASMTRVCGDREEFARWRRLHEMIAGVARRVAPTLIEPLRSCREMCAVFADEAAWTAFVEEPLSQLLERALQCDLVRGVVLTDATIGTFAAADDRQLRQNRCFMYHVIGDSTGLWKVPVGGMGALTVELAAAAGRAGADLRPGAEVTSIETDETQAEVRCADGSTHRARHVLSTAAPAVLCELLGELAPEAAPEGSQLKINMLLRRLPRLRDPTVRPELAFAGTFHVNEGYEQLQLAYQQAAAGQIPVLPPCELYCHSLTDPTILSDELAASGAQTLTLFGLHMPARLFRALPEQAKREAVQATIKSVDSVLAEPLEDCLLSGPDGAPCLEALTPLELESQLAMPGGHIFHRDLAWPFAQTEAEVGSWGTETEHANIWLCGAGARRGGGVSGIAGHNAARAVLEASSGSGAARAVLRATDGGHDPGGDR